MPLVAVLGANGLIGHALARDLKRRGIAVRGYARHFTQDQRNVLDGAVVEAALPSVPHAALAALLEEADLVINAIGILQGADSNQVHREFASRLASACAASGKLLVHISIPGEQQDDSTLFSRSKREGEQAIMASGAPYVILRPGFVIASAVYGGSALIRALAVLPLDLPGREKQAPFAATAIGDLCETVAHILSRWRGGVKDWRESWDVMEERPGTVGDILAAFRAHLGGPKPLLTVPGWMLTFGAWNGDLAEALGWKPPIRSTAIREMRRGVRGDSQSWRKATGIVPQSARDALDELLATIQEKWFARLYLLKALALVTLVVFWIASGTIALTMAFVPARQILLQHGFSFGLAHGVTIASSLLDISVGLLIAFRRTCRAGLVAGILVSLGYMIGAAILTPDLWAEPLGALVKTGPAIVLMVVCLALLDDR